MAKIATYPVVTPTADDTLIGTNGDDDKTKNFTVGAIGDLAIAGHTAAPNPHPQYLASGDYDWSTIPNTPASFPPAAHASSHASAGADPLTLSESQVTGLTADLGAKAPTARQLTINGSAFDLSADRTWTVGTVTSVALTVPGVLFSVAGSPITAAGTLALSLLTQNANTVFAGPASGVAATPTMRALVALDLPSNVSYKDVDNVFSVAQGIRVAATTVVAGLYVPWVAGDSLPALIAGAVGAGNNQIGVYGKSNSAQGVIGESVTGEGVRGVITGTSGTPLLARRQSAATNATPTMINMGITPTGTAAAGLGCTIRAQASSDTTAGQDQLAISSSWVDATHASRKARVTYNVYDTAIREGLRMEASGSAPMIGFLGANAVVRQTLSAAASDAATTQTLANSLRTALINLGLGI